MMPPDSLFNFRRVRDVRKFFNLRFEQPIVAPWYKCDDTEEEHEQLYISPARCMQRIGRCSNKHQSKNQACDLAFTFYTREHGFKHYYSPVGPILTTS